MSYTTDATTEVTTEVTIENFNEKLQYFIDALAALSLINDENPGKLGICDNKLYKSWTTLGSLQRTFYRENHKELIHFLETTIHQFAFFYRDLFQLLEEQEHSSSLQSLAKAIETSKIHMLLWSKGMMGLQKIYPADNDFNSRINELLDMINEINSITISQ